jgi:hypothetical protein
VPPGTDAGLAIDAGFVEGDGGAIAPDGGMHDDAAAGRDAGAGDAGRSELDAGVPDAGAPDAGVRDAGPRDAGAPTTCAPAPGRLAIVELMIASQSGTDRGEWFEVLNTGTCVVDLRGLVLSSPTGAGVPVTHTVTVGTVTPGRSFVFALSGDPAENHGLTWDYVYGTGTSSDIFLGNTGDSLTLLDASGATIDSVVWGDAFTRGAARQFPSSLSPSLNDDWSRWCDSRRIYSTTGGTFFGTPGGGNDACP